MLTLGHFFIQVYDSFLPIALAGILSAVFVPFFIRIAYRYSIVDKPDNKLKRQSAPVAYLGGVAIYLSIALTSLFFFPDMASLILGMGFFLLLGLVDDIWPMLPSYKFFAQLIIGIYCMSQGYYLHEVSLYPWAAYGISLFWIVGVVNAFNLVDIMDGLAVTIAFCALVSFSVSAFLVGSLQIASFAITAAAALIPFMGVNYPPARMYLGDAGSLMLGALLALFPFTIRWTTITLLGTVAPLIILGLILLECFSLIIIRLRKGIPPYYGSRDHFAHYLLDNGWSKKQILGYVILLSGYMSLIVAFLITGTIAYRGVAVSATLFFAIWFFFLKKPFRKR